MPKIRKILQFLQIQNGCWRLAFRLYSILIGGGGDQKNGGGDGGGEILMMLLLLQLRQNNFCRIYNDWRDVKVRGV